MAAVAPVTSEPMECNTKLTYVDANGLALCCFGFATWLFACLNLDVTSVATLGGGFKAVGTMLTWGVSLGLVVSGLVQGFNGDKLGFTSYIFHACLLGTIGYNIETFVSGDEGVGLVLTGQFCFAGFIINIVFTLMAFKAAKMFGILYATVALLFLMVGFSFCGVFGAGNTGATLVGVCALIVSVQCFYLLFPVLAGKGPLF